MSKYDDLIQLIDDYQYNKHEMSYGDKEWLFDGLVDLLEELHNEDEPIEEGRSNQGMFLTIEYGDDIPRSFSTTKVFSPFTDKKYNFNVKFIKNIAVKDNGNLSLELIGTKRVVKEDS